MAASLPPPSIHCDRFKKYSKAAVSGAASIRSATTGCRFETARSISLPTCADAIACPDKMSTKIDDSSIA
jgi:hypothetical protein